MKITLHCSYAPLPKIRIIIREFSWERNFLHYLNFECSWYLVIVSFLYYVFLSCSWRNNLLCCLQKSSWTRESDQREGGLICRTRERYAGLPLYNPISNGWHCFHLIRSKLLLVWLVHWYNKELWVFALIVLNEILLEFFNLLYLCLVTTIWDLSTI